MNARAKDTPKRRQAGSIETDREAHPPEENGRRIQPQSRFKIENIYQEDVEEVHEQYSK